MDRDLIERTIFLVCGIASIVLDKVFDISFLILLGLFLCFVGRKTHSVREGMKTNRSANFILQENFDLNFSSEQSSNSWKIV